MKSIIVIVLIALASNGFSQINTFYVSPMQTDINYATEQDSHLIVRNTTTNNNKLFLFIGGTGSSTQSYFRISEFAGNMGYDVINLSYLNEIPAASLKNSSDSLAFDKYRQEICFGTPLSTFVTVDSLNSIQTRTIKLLNFLQATYPAQFWNQYLINPTTLDWSRITVGGHSQGAGHAAYFAKSHEVERVLMFSGPNDYSDYYDQPAHWLRSPGNTPAIDHIAYLSLLDEVVDFSMQFSNLEELGLFPLFDSTHVDLVIPPYDKSHILYTTQSPGIAILHHNATMKFSLINNDVWEYMLTIEEVNSVYESPFRSKILIYPNPTNSKVSIRFKEGKRPENFYLSNFNGQTILIRKITSANEQQIDLSSFKNGVYFLSVGTEIFKIIKE